MNILIDTNIALYFLGGDKQISGVIDGQVVHVSFVTELELLGYPGITDQEDRLIRDFLDDCIVIDLNGQIKGKTVQLRRRIIPAWPVVVIGKRVPYLQTIN